MLESLVNDEKFAGVMQESIRGVLSYFVEEQKPFGVLCRVANTSFEPPLPKDIVQNFSDVALFVLAEYTLQSATIKNDALVFEAGFGSENIGSEVSVELLGVAHIVVDEVPVFINVANPIKKDELENSMASFLNNPENSKFFK
ncbi:MAG: hypothetical protein WC144_05135 [Sulfurimonas sp.]|nr:hypothetical protein [Sulfurimonadaceae bacterium]